jgi:hypothetical protein
VSTASGVPDTVSQGIAGDRGPAVVARRLSLQGKLQNGLALAVVALLGGGFLAWYYTRLAVKPPPVETTRAEAATRGEMTLPPLGPAPARPRTVQETPLVEVTSAEARALLSAPADPLDPALAAGSPAADPRAAPRPEV